MEALVDTSDGRTLNVRPNGAEWGRMEDYDRYIAELRDPAQWHGALCLIRVPDMPYADGERFVGGTVSLDWLAAHEPVESLQAWEFELIAGVGDAY